MSTSVPGHFHEIELVRTTTERAKVRVFIPDWVKTSDGQRAFAEAHAHAEGAWIPEGVSVKVSDLSRKEMAITMEMSEYNRMYDQAYGDKR